MPKKDLTEIVFILDCSGSMMALRYDAIAGFNDFLAEQQGQPGEALFTLAQFNTTYTLIHDGIDLREAQPLLEQDYLPDHSTALYDAIGFTAQVIAIRHLKMPEAERPERVLVAIFTDGQENASRCYSNQAIYDLIKQKTEREGWDFYYVGCGSQTYVESSRIGIDRGSSFSYEAGGRGTRSGFNSISGYMTGGRSGIHDPAASRPAQPKPQTPKLSLEEQIGQIKKKKRVLN